MRRRIIRLNGGGRVVLRDSFTDVDNTDLLDHAAEDGKRWFNSSVQTNFPYVESNRLRAQAVVGGHFRLKRTSRRRKNGVVEADIIRTGVLGTGFWGIVLRAFGQEGEVQSGLIPRAVTLRFGGGTWGFVLDQLTFIGSTAIQTLTQDQVYRVRFEARGPRHLFWRDGVLILNNEGVYTRRNFCVGVQMQNNAATESNLRLDNWMVTR